MRVLFICTGNTCRSPMAEGYFQSLVEREGMDNMEISSAGTFAGDGEPASTHSRRSASKIGIDIANHKSTPLTPELLNSADIIVAMTASHKTHVGSLVPAALAKTRLMGELSSESQDVSDPFGGDADIYDDCLKSMIPSLNALFNEIRKRRKIK